MSERRIGILIASSRFPEESKLEDLRFPENDVDGLNEILTSQDHGQFTQTFLLKNKLHHEILLKINQVLREAGKNDLVLIYYSGHGKLNPAGKLHLTSTDSVINALEATSIPVSTIRDYVDISSSNKIVLILDCCFSGAAGEAFARGGVDDQLHLVSGGRGTYILTASTGIQVAQEKESDQYGVFTKHLIEGIKSGEADLDSDGRITMGDLYRYVHDKVLDEGFQEPMKWDLNVRGEMVIARSGKTPREERRKQIREILFDLAQKGFLPDEIFDKARLVISLGPDQLSEKDRTYGRLLDQLLDRKILAGEFISKWYKVKVEKPAFKLKEQEEQERKAAEEKSRKEHELKQKAEKERQKKDAGAKPKLDSEAPSEPKLTEQIAPEPHKSSKTLKFGAVAGVIVLLIVGIWWWGSRPPVNEVRQLINEVRQDMEELDRQTLNLVNAVAEIDKPEQIKEFTRQRNTLSHQVEGLSEQAIKIGMRSQLEQLQDRLERIQIELANKEKELIAARKGPTSPQKTITNSIGMKFVLIPAGNFLMGSPPDEKPKVKDDEKQHEVRISKPFYLQATEVSQGQWERIMGNNPSHFKDCGDDCPVERVSWNDAQKFISKLNQMEGTNTYRLPSEAEWEYACRAGTTTPFFTGWCISTDQANYSGTIRLKNCPRGEYRQKAIKVGSFQPNAWGLYDMHGNVYEWVQDRYGDYPSKTVVNPRGPTKGNYRVFRGGMWGGSAGFARSANREYGGPGYRIGSIGFRVARDL